VRDAADDAYPVSALESRAQRSVTDERQRSLAACFEGPGEPKDVLAFGQPAEAEEPGAAPVPSDLAAGVLGVARRESLEVDTAIDHVRLRRSFGQCVHESSPKPVRHRDDVRRPADHEAGGSPHAGDRADVRHVLSVRGDDERSARRERRGQSRGNEEVRVGDVGSKAARRPAGIPHEPDVARASCSPPVDDRPLDLVAPREELVLEVRDENSEIRVVRPRVHLGDEQNPQRFRYPRVTWRIPRHISSVVPSPQRT
jgi:hypothetical protein